jgi:starvation-inducible outer membrane lipoprotein
MIWRKRYKLLAIAVLIFGAVALMGCSQVPKKLEGEKLLVKENKLDALDSFWDRLGGKKQDLVSKTK